MTKYSALAVAVSVVRVVVPIPRDSNETMLAPLTGCKRRDEISRGHVVLHEGVVHLPQHGLEMPHLLRRQPVTGGSARGALQQWASSWPRASGLSDT